MNPHADKVHLNIAILHANCENKKLSNNKRNFGIKMDTYIKLARSWDKLNVPRMVIDKAFRHRAAGEIERFWILF